MAVPKLSGTVVLVTLALGSVSSSQAALPERAIPPLQFVAAEVGYLVPAAVGYVLAEGGAHDRAWLGVAGIALVLASPAVSGLAACAVGSASSDYEGSCGDAIGGAYVGLLGSFALGMVHQGLFPSSGRSTRHPVMFVLEGLTLVTAVFVLPPLGATLGWQLQKQPRAAPADVAALTLFAARF